MRKVSIIVIVIMIVVASLIFMSNQYKEKKIDDNLIQVNKIKTPEELDQTYRHYKEYIDSTTQNQLVSSYHLKQSDEQSAIQDKLLTSQMLVSVMEETSGKDIKIFNNEANQLVRSSATTGFAFELTNTDDDGNQTTLLKIDSNEDDHSYLFAWYSMETSQTVNTSDVSFHLYSKSNKVTYEPDKSLSSWFFPNSGDYEVNNQGLIVYRVPNEEEIEALTEVVSFQNKTTEGRYADDQNYN